MVSLSRNGTFTGQNFQVPNGIAYFILRGDNPETSSFLFDFPGEVAQAFEQRVDTGSPGVTVFASGSLSNPGDYIPSLVNTAFDEVAVLSFEHLTGNTFYTIQTWSMERAAAKTSIPSTPITICLSGALAAVYLATLLRSLSTIRPSR